MRLSKHGIDIRNVLSLEHIGMYFHEFLEFHEMVVAHKDGIIAKKDAKIAALENLESQWLETLDKVMSYCQLSPVHALIQAGFSIEKIAEILGYSVEYAEKLAAIEFKKSA